MRIEKLRIVSCISVPILFGLTLGAATIVSESGPIGPTTGAVNGGIGLEVSWTSSITYTNVNISANLSSGSPTASGTDTFFLTTRIGPGTTTADEITRNTLTVPAGPQSVLPIFSGLTLPAGNYFLVLGGPFTPAIFWSTSDSPTITTGAGVTFDGTGVASPNCGVCPYVPATTFDTSSQFHYLFEVSGTAPVPEPSSAAFFFVGLLAIAGALFLKSFVAPRV
jgi:hypothetical protein